MIVPDRFIVQLGVAGTIKLNSNNRTYLVSLTMLLSNLLLKIIYIIIILGNRL